MIKRFLFVFPLLLLLPVCSFAQGYRFSSQVTQQGTILTTTNVVVVPPGPIISFCSAPANAVPCTNKATTYTDATLTTSCPTSTQIVLDGTSTCVASPDAQNNWGVWVSPGQYSYTISVNGVNLGPYFVTAGGSGASSNNPPSPGSYYIFLSSSSNCLSPLSTGSYVCAVNQQTQTLESHSGGTDATAEVTYVLTAMAAACGHITFGLGKFPFNTLHQETIGTYTNYYAVGIPNGTTGSSSCQWHISGTTPPGFVGAALGGGTPPQLGTILNLTSTAIATTPLVTDKISFIFARPSASGASDHFSYIYLDNLDVRVPDNQRGCETEVDMGTALASGYDTVLADTAYAGSLLFPVEASCTNFTNFGDKGGLVQITSTFGARNQGYITNVQAIGGDECISINAEHTTMIQGFANNCNYGIAIGLDSPPSGGAGPVGYPIEMSESGCGEVARCFTIGTQVSDPQRIDGIGLELEDAGANNTWSVVYHASDASNGSAFGHWSYIHANQSGYGPIPPAAGFFDGPGSSNIQVAENITVFSNLPTNCAGNPNAQNDSYWIADSMSDTLGATVTQGGGYYTVEITCEAGGWSVTKLGNTSGTPTFTLSQSGTGSFTGLVTTGHAAIAALPAAPAFGSVSVVCFYVTHSGTVTVADALGNAYTVTTAATTGSSSLPACCASWVVNEIASPTINLTNSTGSTINGGGCYMNFAAAGGIATHDSAGPSVGGAASASSPAVLPTLALTGSGELAYSYGVTTVGAITSAGAPWTFVAGAGSTGCAYDLSGSGTIAPSFAFAGGTQGSNVVVDAFE